MQNDKDGIAEIDHLINWADEGMRFASSPTDREREALAPRHPAALVEEELAGGGEVGAEHGRLPAGGEVGAGGQPAGRVGSPDGTRARSTDPRQPCHTAGMGSARHARRSQGR